MLVTLMISVAFFYAAALEGGVVSAMIISLIDL
jgi:hypothetical protein